MHVSTLSKLLGAKERSDIACVVETVHEKRVLLQLPTENYMYCTAFFLLRLQWQTVGLMYMYMYM